MCERVNKRQSCVQSSELTRINTTVEAVEAAEEAAEVAEVDVVEEEVVE